MKIYFYFLIISLVFFLKTGYGQDKNLQMSVGTQFSLSKLDWSIAGTINGTSPNVLSELKYDKILTIGPELKMLYSVSPKVLIEVNYQKGITLSGKANDRDFAGDNRTEVTYDESFDSNKGSQSYYKIAVHYCFLQLTKLAFSARTNFSQNQHTFYLLKETFPELNTTYASRWRGIALSLGANYTINNKTSIVSEVSYSFLKYTSKANWNLIKEFQHPLSFKQRANGNGWLIKAQIERDISNRFKLYLDVQTSALFSTNGTDIAYYKHQESKSTKFNGANYYLKSISFGLTWNI